MTEKRRFDRRVLLLLCCPILVYAQLEIPESHRGFGGLGLPTVVTKTLPRFTAKALEAKLEGAAVLRVTIDENGKPQDAAFVGFFKGTTKVDDPLGLDQMALECIKTWRFRPAMSSEGKPISVRESVEVAFRLPQ